MTHQKIMLDTNAYSAIGTGDSRARAIADKAEDITLPITVIGEIYFGAFDGKLQKYNLDSLDNLLSLPSVHVVHVDQGTAIMYGEISAELKKTGKSLQQNDIWIAALAKQHNYPLMTHDQAFSHIIGLRLISW